MSNRRGGGPLFRERRLSTTTVLSDNRAEMILLARCLTILVAIGAIAIAQPVRWGALNGGLRLGIRTTKAANRLPVLEVVIENRGGVRVIEFSDVSVGLVGNLQFQAVRNGKTLDVFDTAILKLSNPGLILSSSVELMPGDQRRFIIPFDRLICVINRRDVPAREVLINGYSNRAGFTVSGVTLTTPDVGRDDKRAGEEERGEAEAGGQAEVRRVEE